MIKIFQASLHLLDCHLPDDEDIQKNFLANQALQKILVKALFIYPYNQLHEQKYKDNT